MSPARNLETRMIDQRRARPAALDRALGQRCCDVKPRQRVRRGGDRLTRLQGRFDQILEMRRLGRQRMRPGLSHLQRRVVQIGRIEAHDAGERLAVREPAIGLHQRIAVFRRHLDMIAEHAIVPDLERADSGALTVIGLQRSDRAASAGAGRAQIIQRGVISLGDVTAIARIDRRRRHQRARVEIDQRAVPAEQRRQLSEQNRRPLDPVEPLTQTPGTVEPVA